MRRSILVLALALVLAGCGGGNDAPGAGSPTLTPTESSPTPTQTNGGGGGRNQVEVVDIDYNPNEITVSAGQTVKWVWEGALSHTVTADDGSFDSGNQGRGATFEHTFDEPGRYEYYCELHSTAEGNTQNGVVIVE